jgi:glutamate-5-semialdehyde dehydrogenase
MSLHEDMVTMGDRAVTASRELARLTARKKNIILQAMAGELEARREALKAANAQDVSAARTAGMKSANSSSSLLA